MLSVGAGVGGTKGLQSGSGGASVLGYMYSMLVCMTVLVVVVESVEAASVVVEEV